MNIRSSVVAVALMATVGLSGCDLDVENPNAPDVNRALSDPGGLEALLSGGFQTWATTRGDYYSALPLTAMADNYSASWNNAAIRFYSSVNECAPIRCGWTNSATADETAGGPAVESAWYGYYTVLSAANDVLAAIGRGICFDGNFTADDCAADNTLTSRNTAIAKMLQGMALGGISQLYDQGFIVDETTDLTAVLTAPFNTAAEIRDAALTKLDEAHAEAALHTWSTPTGWMGVGAGRAYTSSQIQRLIRTMQAELIAMFPRDDAEVAGTDWARVATLASAGISTGTPFEFEYFIDAANVCGIDCVKTWGNAILTMRVDNRVASKITNHVAPWPEPAGNPCPLGPGVYGVDRRVGDGSYGPEDDFNGAATFGATANAGTDFACSGAAIFSPARGQYHQSNLQHVRYQHLTYEGEGLPGENGEGQDPYFTRWMNELLWAEGLLRSGGSAAAVAAHINTSRVGRGGLPALTGAEAAGSPTAPAVGTLYHALYYEQDIEFMGQGATPYFNVRRRAPSCANPCAVAGVTVEGLINGTPRNMPVPDQELQILLRANYTFGGLGPAKLGTGNPNPTVRERWLATRNKGFALPLSKQ
jgi:hypothetical protein